MGRKKKNSTRNMNIAALILIIFAIVFAVLIYTRSGYIGKQLSPALGGVFGYIKYFIPIFLLVGAVKTFIDKDTRRYKKKIIMILIILILIDVVLATSLLSKNNVLSINDSLGDSLSKAFDEGKKDSGGGVIGTLFAVPLVGLFGVVPTIIIAIGFALVMAVYIFDLHPIDTLSDLNEKKKAQEAKYDKRDKKEAEREALRIQKLREKEEKRQEALANRKRGEDELEDQITINIKSAQNGTTNQNVKGVEVPNFTNVGEKKKHSLFNLHKKDEEEEKKPEVTTAKIEPQKDDIFKQEAVEKEEKTKEVLQIEHARLEQEQNYEFPPISILGNIEQKTGNSRKELLATAEKLRKTLQSFGVNAKVENVSVGPAITRYELAPAQGVRVSKIANLADDIALSLEAETIRIEAPIPGKHTVGIEVPNKSKSIVPLRDIIESDKFISDKSKVAFALGKDVAGEIMVTEINKMPHLLIAGSTGSGKSVCINTLITSILYKAKPSEVKLLMIDPKVVELSVYNGIPHLLLPVVTDPKKASGALVWAVKEMENRYSLFAQNKVRDIKGYNEEAQKKGEPQLPQMVIIIDELADLMMVAAKDVEDSICRLAQMARAAGMFLVIATQRPSVDVITGIIKANIPSRIAFAVSSQVDSRTILDGSGAEKLLGKGDMLFFPSGAPKPVRIQGAFVSDKEVENLVNFVKRDGEDTYDPKIMDEMDKIQNQQNKDKNGRGDEEDDDDDTDPLLNEAIEMVIQSGTASTSYIQRRFKVGYARAGRIIDQMEERGVISGYAGSKPREVIMTMDRWRELNMAPGMDANSSDGDEDNKSI